MGDNKTLLVGFDINNDYTQISCFNRKLMEPESVCVTPDKSRFAIPTCLLVKESNKEWVFGDEAVRLRNLNAGFFVDDLVGRLMRKEDTEIYGTFFSPQALMEKYFRKTLGFLRQHYLNNSILKIVVTGKELEDDLVKELYAVLERLGIKNDRAIILNHVQCFIYYAISQKPELWPMDVGLFEYAKEGLMFYHLKIDRKTDPVTIVVDKIDLSNEFPAGAAINRSKEEVAEEFAELAKRVLMKRMITTLYLTGYGFEGEWIYDAVKPLCIGRRVFKGQNLYTRGACYGAKGLEYKEFENFLILSDELITSTISLKLYANAAHGEYVLIKAGTPWKKAEKRVTFILDHSNELEFRVSNLLKKDVIHEIMKLDGMMNRENKTIRLELTIRFLDRDTPIATVRDIGFGEFFPTTMRIWEQELQL